MTNPANKPRLDSIAREAARLLETGAVDSMRDALHKAAEALGKENGPLPGPGRVRKHAQAMAMQALGTEGYEARRRAVWQIAEELMTAMEHALPGLETLLVGRAAQGHIDGGVTLHIRLYTDRTEAELAHMLVDFGYEEPIFDTVNTSYGRVNRLLLSDEGIEIVLTRCLPQLNVSKHTDMFTGKAIAAATVHALRQMIDRGA